MPKNQEAECFTRDSDGYALDAAGKRLVVQPPDVTLRIAKALGLQEMTAPKHEKYVHLGLLQQLDANKQTKTPTFWCNLCRSVISLSRNKEGGAILASAWLRHVKAKHPLYVLPVDFKSDFFADAAEAAEAAAAATPASTSRKEERFSYHRRYAGGPRKSCCASQGTQEKSSC